MKTIDPAGLQALARARAEVQRLESELGLSGTAGALPSPTEEAAAWWTEVAHLSRDFLSVHASNGDYLFASPSCERLFGWTPDQLRGTNAYTYFHPDDLARIASSHASHGGDGPEDGDDARVRYRLRCADGTWRWVETTSHAHSDDDLLQRIVCTTRVVDEQVALEQRLQRSNERLERFATVTAHDIKAPLTTIASISELLSLTAGPHLRPSERHRLGLVHEAAMRLAAVVDSLLDWALVEGGAAHPEDTDLGDLARVVLTDLRADIDRTGAAVAVGTLPTVRTDPTLTRLLLQNLVANALKFTQPNHAPQVRIDATRSETGWQLAVTDQGPGIPTEQQGRIFDLYERADDGASAGQGIGLAMCARIAEKQGGRIWVESEPGAGARFVVELPGTRPAPATA